MPKAYNLVGQRFGRLTVIEKAGHKWGKVMWKCLCDCGKETYLATQTLTSGLTKSCGCFCKENQKNFGNRTKTHGMTKERIHAIWNSMKQRCNNKKLKGYENYGGRGITVCEEWKKFENFYKWAMENGYTEKLTIERIDNNGNYCPDNCRWATKYEQDRNKRNNVYITYNGETKILGDWAKFFGIERSLLRYRINKLGWPIEKALTTPVDKSRSHKKKSINTQKGG